MPIFSLEPIDSSHDVWRKMKIKCEHIVRAPDEKTARRLVDKREPAPIKKTGEETSQALWTRPEFVKCNQIITNCNIFLIY